MRTHLTLSSQAAALPREVLRRCVLLLAVTSGGTALGYEVVWTQQLGVVLGHELSAALAVVAAFFAGLGLGARVLSRRIEHGTHPARAYALCEGVSALWALCLGELLPRLGPQLAAALGPAPAAALSWAVTFAGTTLLLLPATCALGATLPALERVLRSVSRESQALPALYAANTLGAVLGVLSCAFVLVPELGLTWTARGCALLNAGCAVSALVLLPAHVAAPAPAPKAHALRTKLRWMLFATGLLGVGFEVAALRVLCQVTENTVYSFAICLAVYLAGSALGAALFQRWPCRTDDAAQRDRLLALAALGCGLGAVALCWSAPYAPGLARGPGLALELALAALAFLPPTLAFGALFSQLCLEARHNGQSLGGALAMNTWGAALAPLVFGVGLMPALGPCAVLALVALGYVLFVRRAGAYDVSTRHTLRACLPAALACAGLALASPVQRGRYGLQEGELVQREEGVSASVSVLRNAQGVRTLHIDHREQEGSDATLYADARQAWLPLLLHPAPRRALFLGLGTGLTAGAAAWDPALEVDAVELLPEVARASEQFTHALHSARRPQIWLADARRFVRAAPAPYDVIVSDLFHPARSGAAALYTVEHFHAVSQQLTEAGVFCQWLPLHQLDMGSLRSIVASFLTVYPGATAMLATGSLDTPVLGLIGTRARPDWSLSAMRERVRRSEQQARLPALQLDDELAVLGSFISGAAALRELAGAAPPNTDDRPIVAYRAPFASHAPRELLIMLTQSLQVAPDDVLGANPAASSAERLTRYWTARDRFLALGMRVPRGASASELLAQVRAPLLEILRECPEFRPAYDPLLSMARALSADASAEALPLLRELAAVQPARPEAQELLRRVSLAVAQP